MCKETALHPALVFPRVVFYLVIFFHGNITITLVRLETRELFSLYCNLLGDVFTLGVSPTVSVLLLRLALAPSFVVLNESSLLSLSLSNLLA